MQARLGCASCCRVLKNCRHLWDAAPAAASGAASPNGDRHWVRRRRLLHRTCVTIGSAIVASKQRATWRSEASETLLQLRLISQRLRPRCSAALLGLLLLLLRSSRHHRETSELMTIASCEMEKGVCCTDGGRGGTLLDDCGSDCVPLQLRLFKAEIWLSSEDMPIPQSNLGSSQLVGHCSRLWVQHAACRMGQAVGGRLMRLPPGQAASPAKVSI